MDNLEVMYWVTIIQQAKESNKEAQEMLQVENEIRTDKGLMTVGDELKGMVEEAEAKQKIEQAKAKKMQQK